MQKEKGDAAISVATVTGNAKALCNLAYCIFGLSALTHMLARGATGLCAVLPIHALQVSLPGFSPRIRQPLGAAPLLPGAAGSSRPCSADSHLHRAVPGVPMCLAEKGSAGQGQQKRIQAPWGLAVLGERMAHARAVQNVCNGECVERLKQFRDVSKPFSTEPGLAGTYRRLRHGP